jgi:hypothetical protein
MSPEEAAGEAPPVPVQPPAAEQTSAAASKARSRRRLRRAITLGMLMVFGVGALRTGSFLLRTELTRSATHAEAAAAGDLELASRWQRLSAGQIFPARFSFLGADGYLTDAQRVGIATPANSGAALDRQVVVAMAGLGCLKVLRATYTDPAGSYAATFGIAIMTSQQAAQEVAARLTAIGQRAGVLPPAFPGTMAAGFGTRQREFLNVQVQAGPYVYFVAAGRTDGRLGSADPADAAALALAVGLMNLPNVNFLGSPTPCAERDIRC